MSENNHHSICVQLGIKNRYVKESNSPRCCSPCMIIVYVLQRSPGDTRLVSHSDFSLRWRHILVMNHGSARSPKRSRICSAQRPVKWFMSSGG